MIAIMLHGSQRECQDVGDGENEDADDDGYADAELRIMMLGVMIRMIITIMNMKARNATKMGDDGALPC